MTDGFDPPPRTVRPRKRTYPKLFVVAIDGDTMLTERGQLMMTSELHGSLPQAPCTLFVRLNAADFVAGLSARMESEYPNSWQWRVSTSERDIVRPDGFKIATRISTVVHFFGFKGGNYHKIIDPIAMYGHNLDKIWPNGDSRIEKLLAWGIALRDFCHQNNLQVRPTMGAISAQLLTDSRFYPRSRRKVPAAINERAREQLPGNHYLLNTQPTNQREFKAWYLDQSRAHHYHARTVQLPDANSLYAYGFFTGLEDIAFDRVIENFYGLYCLDLQLPPNWRFSNWVKSGDRQFVFSNELPHLLDAGYRVNGVYAAWGSRRQDTGIRRLAKWADEQLDHYGDAPWIKPLLLSTYGTLATRPRYGEAVFRLAKGGENVTLVTGNNELSGKLVKATRKLEPGIANVLHRGMIEAGTRSESIGLAQWLAGQGYHVLSIYADAVIVEDEGDKQLPVLLEPWRCKQTLNHLQFINQQAFVSGEMTKLPGVTGEMRRYARNSIGYAPHKVMYDIVTEKQYLADRRI